MTVRQTIYLGEKYKSQENAGNIDARKEAVGRMVEDCKQFAPNAIYNVLIYGAQFSGTNDEWQRLAEHLRANPDMGHFMNDDERVTIGTPESVGNLRRKRGV